jgi:hypothetical protein
MSVLTSVTELEDRVVDTVTTIQEPVISYVRKGVERVEGRLPKLSYPKSLPEPTELVDSQFGFVRKLLESQRVFVAGLVDALTPLVRMAPTAEPEARTAPKTKVKPASSKSTTKTSETASPKASSSEA